MKNTERFADRAGNYASHRPAYPAALFDYIYGTLGATASSVFADVGAGTGKFTRFLLERGSHVFAVEPNVEMALNARQSLECHDGFVPVNATAENTTLPSTSVDYVACAQAFHWFDQEACRSEFTRILKPGGQALIIFNRMDSGGNAFMAEYERIHYAHSNPNRTVDARKITQETLTGFFRGGIVNAVSFPYSDRLDCAGLVGRMQSSSHAPLPGDARYAAMKDELESLFAAHRKDGVVELVYRTDLYFGLL